MGRKSFANRITEFLGRIPSFLVPVGEGDLEKRIDGEEYDGAVVHDTLVGGFT